MSTNNSCGYSDEFWAACRLITYCTHTYIPPICLLLGVPSHVIALIAFLKHRNADTAYSYQILATVTKTLEILGMFQFAVLFYHGAGQDWSGEGATGVQAPPGWYVSNGGAMWFTAHVSPVLAAATTDVAVFASAATAADRVFALSRPFAYQSINHTRHFLVALILCFLIPSLCEFHWAFSFGLVPAAAEENSVVSYSIQYVTFFSDPFIKSMWSNLAALIRTIAVVTLIVCSVFMTYRFRRRNVKIQQIRLTDSSKEAKRRANEKSLFFLALFQCTATTLPAVLMTVWDLTSHFDRSFVSCGGMMLSPILDLSVQVVNVMDVYFMWCVSSGFRRMVAKVFRRGGVSAAHQSNGQQQSNVKPAAAGGAGRF